MKSVNSSEVSAQINYLDYIAESIPTAFTVSILPLKIDCVSEVLVLGNIDCFRNRCILNH